MASRILMISTNREFAPQPTIPVGAAWVAEALYQAGFSVAFLDLCFEKHPVKRVDEALLASKPDGIALSIRNIDNCDFLAPRSFLPELRELVTHLTSRTSAPILIGGSGVSIMPLQILDYLGLDHAVVGEGEVAAVRFFRSGRMGYGGRIPGLVCRGDDPNPGENCAPGLKPDLVVPQLHRWVDSSRYLRYEPVLPVQGKRGCSNSCLYCTYNRIEGRTWRLRDPAAVVEELATAMVKTGAREFEFVDSIFNQPEGYAETLLEEIIRRRVKAKFHVSSLSPKGLTQEQVRLMERAGMASVVITPESASDVTLSALCKDFTEEEVIRAAEILSGSSIKALWCFLLGGPKEDAKTLSKTMGFIRKRMSRKDSAFLTTGIRIYPDTGLHELAIREGVVGKADTLLMPSFYFTPLLTPQEARGILQKGLADFRRCIFLSDTTLGSIGGLRRIGTFLRLPSPFWRYAGYMNRMMSGSRVISRNW